MVYLTTGVYILSASEDSDNIRLSIHRNVIFTFPALRGTFIQPLFYSQSNDLFTSHPGFL